MPEIPTAAELNIDQTDPEQVARIQANVPENPIDRPYKTKDEYLGIHYRLHREESVAWLRNAVTEYKAEPRMMDTNETCVYTRVSAATTAVLGRHKGRADTRTGIAGLCAGLSHDTSWASMPSPVLDRARR